MANASEPLCIWLHGLGQNACKWHEVAGWPGVRAVAQRFAFLQAPDSPVTAFDGRRVPNWLDMPCVPLTPEAVARDMAHDPRLAASINMVHRAISEAIEQGTPASSIFLGGFSQGAALALLAAYGWTGETRLAGAACFSGWLIEKGCTYTDSRRGGG